MSDDRKRVIAELKQQPGFDALRSWVRQSKEGYFRKLAAALYDGKAISPEDLAYKRGVFRGMYIVLNQVDFSEQAIERELAKDVTEVD